LMMNHGVAAIIRVDLLCPGKVFWCSRVRMEIAR
jgi:hypothetical protein